MNPLRLLFVLALIIFNITALASQQETNCTQTPFTRDQFNQEEKLRNRLHQALWSDVVLKIKNNSLDQLTLSNFLYERTKNLLETRSNICRAIDHNLLTQQEMDMLNLRLSNINLKDRQFNNQILLLQLQHAITIDTIAQNNNDENAQEDSPENSSSNS